MELPQIHAGTFKVNHDKDTIENGDYVYYAPDSTIWYVSNIDPTTIVLAQGIDGDTWEAWEVDGGDLRNNLFVDFFPVELQ